MLKLNFTKATLAAGAAALFLSVTGPAYAQETSLDCSEYHANDPFPFVGDKQEMSREKFNDLAKSVLESIDYGSLGLSEEEIAALQKSIYDTTECGYSKYYDIEPRIAEPSQ